MNFGMAIAHFASHYENIDKPAILFGSRAISYKELNSRANRLAGALHHLGVASGDRVAVLLHNCPEYVEIFAALSRIGAIIAPLSTRSVARELHHAIEAVEPRVLITSPSFAAEVLDMQRQFLSSGPSHYILTGEGAHSSLLSYESLLDSAKDVEPEKEVPEDLPCWFLFSGGTTGLPKACIITHRNWNINQLACTIQFGWRRDDISLLAGSFAHGLPFFFGMVQLFVGGTLCILPRFTPESFLQTVQDRRVTWTAMVPTMFDMIMDVQEQGKWDTSSLRMFVSGGARLREDTKRRIIDYFRGAELYEYYGASEAGYFTLLAPGDQLRKARSCGRSMWGVQIRVFDDHGNALRPGGVGEIYRRGLRWCEGFYKRIADYAEIQRGEWITAGDVGFLDEEGYLYIVDRKKDVIVSGGINVYPSEVEQVIAAHSDVKEVAVVGIPDEKWGEAVHAFVVLRCSGRTVVLERRAEREIQDLCVKELAGFKRPKSIEFVDSLPRSHAGKILKRVLADRYRKRKLPIGEEA